MIKLIVEITALFQGQLLLHKLANLLTKLVGLANQKIFIQITYLDNKINYLAFRTVKFISHFRFWLIFLYFQGRFSTSYSIIYDLEPDLDAGRGFVKGGDGRGLGLFDGKGLRIVVRWRGAGCRDQGLS